MTAKTVICDMKSNHLVLRINIWFKILILVLVIIYEKAYSQREHQIFLLSNPGEFSLRLMTLGILAGFP